MAILKPGQVVVCKCGKHAHVVLSNGFRGPEFAFKRLGYQILYEAVRLYDLDFIESGHIRAQIEASSLPEEHLAVSGYLLWTVDRWNLLLMNSHPELPSIKFHALLKRTRKSQLPTDFFDILDEKLNVGMHPENPKAKHLH